MQRTSYTPEQRADALRLLAEVGKAEAARRTGIPSGTIASWGNRNGVRAPSVEACQKAVDTAALTVTERKALLADRLGVVASKAVAKLEELIDTDRVGAKDLVVAITSAVDRMQLLTGEATSRVEQTIGAAPERTPEQEAEMARVLSLVQPAA
jgi:transposase-like protein